MKKITVNLLNSEVEKREFYRLRHKTCSEELGWVDSLAVEIDSINEGAEY